MSTGNHSSTKRIHFDGGLVILLILAGLVLASMAWGFGLRQDLNHAEVTIESLESEIDQIRQQSNATAYQLTASTDAPPAAQGTAFFALDGTGVISVANLAQAPEGRSYQVWYYPTSEAEPIPGAPFSVDSNGSAFMLIPADVGVFTDITITLEPLSGSTTPSGPVILSGSTGGARG